MSHDEVIRTIADKDFQVVSFVPEIIHDASLRAEVVRQMIANPEIMVYYHCFYVIDAASRENPVLFYGFWSDLAKLLKHANSYKREFGLTLLANLIRVDEKNLFSGAAMEYFALLNDVKFMTGLCCLRNCQKILACRPDYILILLPRLMDLDHSTSYNDKQKELMKCDVLELLDERYETIKDEKGVSEFIRACVSSASPKTRNKAKEMISLLHE